MQAGCCCISIEHTSLYAAHYNRTSKLCMFDGTQMMPWSWSLHGHASSCSIPTVRSAAQCLYNYSNADSWQTCQICGVSQRNAGLLVVQQVPRHAC